MNEQSKQAIEFHFSAYTKKGGKASRRERVSAVIGIFNEIFRREPSCKGDINNVGKRQITGYWKRTEDQHYRVRDRKYKNLCYLFKQLKKSPPPKPKMLQHHLDQKELDKKKRVERKAQVHC